MRTSFSLGGSSILLASSFLAITVSQSHINETRDDLCGIQVYSDGYNASGSVTVPGFRVNDSYSETEWTWTRFVSDEYDPQTNDSSLWQTFGLETTPELNLSDPRLPYTGCIIVPASVMVAGRTDDGTCTGIFNNGCITEILSKVNRSASLVSGTQRGSAPTFSCPQLIQSITSSSSSKCHDQFAGSISTEFLPNDFSPGPPGSRRCLPQNETGHPFLGWGKQPTDPNDFRHYDQAIRTPHPVIVAVWLKATDGELDDLENDVPGWADTKLFCIPANKTEPGSRNLTVANRSAGGAAGRVRPFSWEMMGIVLVSVIVFAFAL